MDCRQLEVAIFKIRSYKAVFFSRWNSNINFVLCWISFIEYLHIFSAYLFSASFGLEKCPNTVVCASAGYILRDRLKSAGPEVVPAAQQFIISLGIILLALEPLLGAKLVELPCIVIVRFLRECIHNNAPIHRANHLQSITIDSCYTIPLPPVLPRTKSEQ